MLHFKFFTPTCGVKQFTDSLGPHSPEARKLRLLRWLSTRQEEQRIAERQKRSKAPLRTIGKAELNRMADEAKLLLLEGRSSVFEFEGACRNGLRSSLCLSGWPWEDADAAAALVIETALKRIGATRPTWQEGQPEWASGRIATAERMNCKGCGAKLPDSDDGRQRSYCSDSCMRSYHGRMRRQFGAKQNRMELVATWVSKREAVAKETSYCDNCGNVFMVGNYRQKKYCSPECVSQVMRATKVELPAIPCPQCQKRFVPKTKEVKFCSRTCVAQSYVAAARRAPKECRHCAKTFQPSIKDESFCSRDCRFRANRKAMVDKPCRNCGAVFAARTDDYHYCSRTCYHDYKASQKAVISCPTCKTQFRRGVKSGRKTYCSDRCRPIGKIPPSNLRCTEVQS